MKIKTLVILMLIITAACNSGSRKEQQSSPTGEALTEVTLSVSGMHCEMCVASIEKGVGQLAGVDSVSAVLSDSAAFVRFNPQLVSLDDITQAIVKRGYTVKSNSVD